MKTLQWTAAALVGLAVGTGGAHAGTVLDIYHVNDLESKLLGVEIDGAPYRGAARLVATANALRSISTDRGRDSMLLSSGDNVLPGLTFEASLRDATNYDAITLGLLNFDAIALGNHDFDFGPNTLADLIEFNDPAAGPSGPPLLSDVPFLSANLDFSGEARLQSLVDSNNIAKSTIVERDGNRYGIIGGQTNELADITQLGNVTVNDFATAVKAEADQLTAAGVDKIVLVSHLQGINNDFDFITSNDLGNIDVIIAGGGDELLVDNAKLTLDEGELVDVYGDEPFDVTGTPAQGSTPGDTYPLVVEDAAGNAVYVVTTTGETRYLGALSIEFDDAGQVVDIVGDPIVVGPNFGEDAATLARVSLPVQATVEEIAQEVIGETEVALESRRPQKRIEEVNLGNLFADAFKWQAEEALGDTLDGKIVVAVQNSGGIRNAALLFDGATSDDPATLTRADTLSIAPFANFLTVADDLTANGAEFDAQTILGMMEHSVSEVEDVDGRFLQISGFKVAFDPDRAAGERVMQLSLEDGTPIWTRSDGFAPGADGLDFVLVTNTFTANGGDGYNPDSAIVPYGDLASLTFADLPFTYEDPLVNYIRDALGGTVTLEQYGAPEGRISEVPLPGAVWLFGAGVAALVIARRRQRRG